MRARQLVYGSLIIAAAALVFPVFVAVGTLVAYYLLPVVALIALCHHPLLLRRFRKAACITRCATCGRSLDALAVQRAKEWVHRAARDGCIGRIRSVDAICGHCGAWYVFDFEHSRFVATNRPPGVHA